MSCNTCTEREDEGTPCGYYDYSMEWVLECGCNCHQGEEGDT